MTLHLIIRRVWSGLVNFGVVLLFGVLYYGIPLTVLWAGYTTHLALQNIVPSALLVTTEVLVGIGLMTLAFCVLSSLRYYVAMNGFWAWVERQK